MTDQKKQNSDHEPCENATMPDPQDKSRRTALRDLLVGAGVLTAYHAMPSKWSQPIIDQIILPAHAATSGSTLKDPCEVSVTKGTTGSSSVTVRVDGFVTPPTGNLPTAIVATPTGGSGGPVTVNTITAADGTFGALMTIPGGPGITMVTVVTTVTGASGSATCSVEVPKKSVSTTPSPTTTVPGPTTTAPLPTTTFVFI